MCVWSLTNFKTTCNLFNLILTIKAVSKKSYLLCSKIYAQCWRWLKIFRFTGQWSNLLLKWIIAYIHMNTSLCQFGLTQFAWILSCMGTFIPPLVQKFHPNLKVMKCKRPEKGLKIVAVLDKILEHKPKKFEWNSYQCRFHNSPSLQIWGLLTSKQIIAILPWCWCIHLFLHFFVVLFFASLLQKCISFSCHVSKSNDAATYPP